MTVIDTHLHVCNTDRLRYPWLEDLPSLNRPMGIPELSAELGERFDEISSFVFVQADCLAEQGLDEVEMVAALAKQHPIAGIVAFAPLEIGADVAGHVAQLTEHEQVVGVRRLLQSEPSGFALTPEFLAGARTLIDANLSFDACVRHELLPDVIALADTLPELRIVLDHLGKPNPTGQQQSSGEQSAWQRDLTELARRSNVSCKLSGLAAETASPSWTAEQLHPFLDHALAAFGSDRCMFGSDWPASALKTDYLRWLDFVSDWAGALSAAEADDVMWRSAVAAYRLPEPGIHGAQ